ncbi:MAG TPA: hydrogenase expression/formation protein HypE [Roseiflexaceae bacterium]|nr:hydrogenase expression/formation protein HypE [Roseiflexaceae bacterium]
MSNNDDRAGAVLAKIERVRRRRRNTFYLRDEHVTLSHGSGGKATHNLIEGVFAPAFANPVLDRMDDSAILDVESSVVEKGDPSPIPNPQSPIGKLAFTTDSYVVSPLFFPGGDIGSLAVHGTVNDLAMAGAEPLYLSAGFVLEEGLPIADLRRIVESLAAAAKAAGVAVVAGDTKVVQRGKADGLFITTAGVGLVRAPWPIGQAHARPGDAVLLSGPIGDHGIAIMLAREALDIEADVRSDSAPLHTLVAALLAAAGPSVHCLKDPTRGGVATALNEIALAAEVSIALDEHAIPVRPEVRGACEILGLDPLTIANEGKLLAIVAPESADVALAAMRAHPLGAEAAIVGEVRAEPQAMVFLRTDIGGTRVLDMLVGDPLPRIC